MKNPLRTSQYLPLSWDGYHQLAEKLGQAILEGNQRFDRIVGISRCGLTLGHILSDLLQLPISIFTMKSYQDINKKSQVVITEKLTQPIKGESILLVDGIADTGQTLLEAITYLRTLKPKKITTATLYYKPHSTYKPDYFVKTSSRWILLPYEFTEYGCSFLRKMKAEGKSPAAINAFLKRLSYSKIQIDRLWKIYKLKLPTLIKE